MFEVALAGFVVGVTMTGLVMVVLLNVLGAEEG